MKIMLWTNMLWFAVEILSWLFTSPEDPIKRFAVVAMFLASLLSLVSFYRGALT
jgi:hypothetical protein